MTTRMGIDPSIAGTGWAVVDSEDIIDAGVIRTKPDNKLGKWEDRARRAGIIGRELVALMKAHYVTAVCIEQPVFNARDGKASVHASARVRGVVEGICSALELRLTEVGSQEVKKAFAGRRDASKEEVARRVRQLFGVAIHDLDATDAIAVAYVGAARAAEAVSGVVSYREPDDELDF